MATVGVGGFGKAKKTAYKGKEAVVKYINTAGAPQATLATCTINRQDAKLEGEIQKLFSKTCVAEVYGIEGHAIYMRYYKDGSLRSQIDKNGANRRRYLCAFDIIRGISEIHRLNFVHSDIKASNVLVEKVVDILVCYISDFGAARLKGTMPIAYTPGFAPSNFFSKPLCFEDDIFSLGKLLLELFGKFKGSEIQKINYDNFFTYVNWKTFTNNYGEFTYPDRCKEVMNAVHECINEDSTKRPSLKDLEKIFYPWNKDN
jgi:serine/threonine protein kinase